VHEGKSQELLEVKLYVSVEDMLDEAEGAVRRGMTRDAYELCLRAIQAEPHNMEAWLLRASLADSLEEKLQCLNRMHELGADRHDRHNVAFYALKELLERDPFLAYMEETDGLYRVQNAEHTVLVIPKRRSVTTSYPNRGADALRNARRWLMLAVFGLIFAGIATLVFAPLAAWAAFNARRSMRTRSGQVDSMVTLAMAAGSFVIGALFVALFIMHLSG
jgi:hypothetical protein